MESCNFSTFSQVVLQSLHTSQLNLNDILAVVTDNASYCLKAYREVLKGVMPHSVHTTCLCHVINLVGETGQHYKFFSEATALVMWVKSAFFKKPALYFLTMKEAEKPKVPPELVSTRWNSWFEAVQYHAEHVHLYKEFFLAEKSSAQAVRNIIELVETDEKQEALHFKLTFISEGCGKLVTALTVLEGTHTPVAVSAYNIMEDLGSFLVNGTAKTLGFGVKTDELLNQMRMPKKRHIHDVFHIAFEKFSKHWDVHPAKKIYKMIRVFDPRQAPAMERHIEAYGTLWELRTPASPELSEQWAAYQHCVRNEGISASLDLADYWKGTSQRFPGIANIAMSYIYFPVSSDCERSFSKYKTLLTDKRESLTELNTKCLTIMWAKDGKCLRKQHMPAYVFKKVLLSYEKFYFVCVLWTSICTYMKKSTKC